jgi:hypothetical protein
MEDWVRAINAARRKLSEREEEERNKREGRVAPAPTHSASQAPTTGSAAVPIPQRERADTIDTHQGTYSSMYTGTSGTSFSASPIATTGYFSSRGQTSVQPFPISSGPASPSLGSGLNIPPSSPMGTTNNLSAQMAKVSMPRTPSGSFQQQQQPKAVPGRRERSTSSYSSAGEQPQRGSTMPVSSDEDETYFSDPNSAFGALGTAAGSDLPTSDVPVQYAQVPGQQVVDPKKVILQGYLMKRSKGRGRKVWKKRWFYLTSQGLTYTKSHMVCLS